MANEETPTRRTNMLKLKPKTLFVGDEVKKSNKKIERKATQESPREQKRKEYISLLKYLPRELGIPADIDPREWKYRVVLEPTVLQSLITNLKVSLNTRKTRSQDGILLFKEIPVNGKESTAESMNDEVMEDVNAYLSKMKLSHQIDTKASKLMNINRQRHNKSKENNVVDFSTPVKVVKNFETDKNLQEQADEQYQWMIAESLLNKAKRC